MLARVPISLRVLTTACLLFAVGVIVLASLALRTDGERADAARSALAPSGAASVLPLPPAQGRKASTSAATQVFDPAQRRADVAARSGRRQYRAEVRGRRELRVAARVARNRRLVGALRNGDVATASAIAGTLLYRKDHVSHIEILRGAKPLVAVGKPFVVAATPVPVTAPGGTRLATLDVSIQDVIGFVRLLHRRTHADVVVRGNPGRVETSLHAALRVALPKRGPVTVAGRRYHVASFREHGLLGEPLRVWVLTRG
jgi:hypothetical protein